MTKRELVLKISRSTKLSIEESDLVFKNFVDAMIEGFIEGESLYIRGFGTFEVKERKAKMGRIISRGEDIFIPAKKVVKFKPSKEWADKIR